MWVFPGVSGLGRVVGVVWQDQDPPSPHIPPQVRDHHVARALPSVFMNGEPVRPMRMRGLGAPPPPPGSANGSGRAVLWSRAAAGVVAVAPPPGRFYCAVCRARPRFPAGCAARPVPRSSHSRLPRPGSARGESAWGCPELLRGVLPSGGPCPAGCVRAGLLRWGLPGTAGAPEGFGTMGRHGRWGFGAVLSLGSLPGTPCTPGRHPLAPPHERGSVFLSGSVPRRGEAGTTQRFCFPQPR